MKFRKPNNPIWSAYLGNFFEHYDSALFGFLVPFLAPLFFPYQDSLTALIFTYAMIPLGMIARPFGSVFFGWIGDKYSREYALFLSMFGMSIVSLGFALCPSYSKVGALAPCLLAFGKILQNFLTSGATIGGAIYILENSKEKSHDLHSSLFNASSIGGILFASSGVALLSYSNQIEYAWRILYLIGCITAVFGCFLRKSSPEKSSSLPVMEQAKSLWKLRKEFLTIILISGFGYANYSIALILPCGLIPFISSFTKEQMAELNIVFLILDFLTLPLFGWLAFRIGRVQLMLIASLGAICFGLPLFSLLIEANLSTVFVVRTFLVLIGVAFCAPFYSWAQELIPQSHRYFMISFGYAIGSQLLGGPTASISLWLFRETGSILGTAIYWVALSIITITFLLLTDRKETNGILLKESVL